MCLNSYTHELSPEEINVRNGTRLIEIALFTLSHVPLSKIVKYDTCSVTGDERRMKLFENKVTEENVWF